MKKIILSFALVLGFASCEKDNGPQLPPIGNEGKNIISWIMDGEFYEAKGSAFFAGNNAYYSLRSDSFLSISARADGLRKVRLDLNGIFKGLNQSIAIGQNMRCAASLSYEGSVIIVDTSHKGGYKFQTDDSHTGILIVTYYDENIIGGTFKMDLVNDAGQVHHITEGQFDIAR